MSTRFRMLLLAGVAVLVTSCSAHAPGSQSMQLPAETLLPPGATQITSPPDQRSDTCDANASLRPSAQPRPGEMPDGSTMAAILKRGTLRVGVDQNSFLFGYRNPADGQIEGFDIDIAREIARDVFGDPARVELHPLDSAHRLTALQGKQVDIVVETLTPTCERRQSIEFSSAYFVSDQRLLVPKNSGIKSSADLAGKKVCGVVGTITLNPILALPQRPTVIGMSNWLDCLTALQQGQVDAASTDAPILYGLLQQDPNLRMVGDALAQDPYAVGVQQETKDLVRFVNGVLERIRGDGTWQRLYNNELAALGPTPGPPAPRYIG
ncbi:glutamate ABC transporter substrate-binding protein [Nocardia sp. NBC_01388]|uniref:glutamate ABC transporter substrate-binding protein n=1 Tax=Nocardia sp. NBC_01388 TaxID=2903596 RepID=UPI0032463A11